MLESLLNLLAVWLLLFIFLGVFLHICNEEWLWKYKKLNFTRKLCKSFLVLSIINFMAIIGIIVFVVTAEFLGKL